VRIVAVAVFVELWGGSAVPLIEIALCRRCLGGLCSFLFVEAAVGSRDERFGGFAGAGCGADGYADWDWRGVRGFEAGREFACQGGRLGVGGVWEEDGELVASEARWEVAGAYSTFDRVGDGAKHGIAELVSMAIVDGLEVVEVEEQ